MTEKLFIGTLNTSQDKTKTKIFGLLTILPIPPGYMDNGGIDKIVKKRFSSGNLTVVTHFTPNQNDRFSYDETLM